MLLNVTVHLAALLHSSAKNLLITSCRKEQEGEMKGSFPM